jgi:hypothetical protein
MRELDNQNPVEAGRSCYRKNPAVYGGSIKYMVGTTGTMGTGTAAAALGCSCPRTP